MTIQDFCQKWSCTPDELWERIGRLFTVKDTAKRIWHQIEANEKKRCKSKTMPKETITTEVTEKVTKEETDDISPHAPTLDGLKILEQEYSNATISLEIAYKDLYAKREEGREAYKRLRNEVKKLKEQHDSKCREAEKIIQRDNKLVDQMNEINAAHGFKQAALEKIREQIKEMRKIVLCVYNSREIAPP